MEEQRHLKGDRDIYCKGNRDKDKNKDAGLRNRDNDAKVAAPEVDLSKLCQKSLIGSISCKVQPSFPIKYNQT